MENNGIYENNSDNINHIYIKSSLLSEVDFLFKKFFSLGNGDKSFKG
jgi:hypothetical protein